MRRVKEKTPYTFPAATPTTQIMRILQVTCYELHHIKIKYDQVI